MMSFESRFFNYFFREGELVKLADDIPYGGEHGLSEKGNWLKKIDLSILKNKVGVVKSCDSDLNSWSHGNSYTAVVQFDELLVCGMAAYFLPLNINEIRIYIAKKRINNYEQL
jgi:hypothetical protein